MPTVMMDVNTHVIVSRQEIASTRLLLSQLLTVMHLAEREPGVTDRLAFECRAARAIVAEHFPDEIELPEAPEE